MLCFKTICQNNGFQKTISIGIQYLNGDHKMEWDGENICHKMWSYFNHFTKLQGGQMWTNRTFFLDSLDNFASDGRLNRGLVLQVNRLGNLKIIL